MFKVKSLPSRYGDSFLIEYGDPQTPHLVLIDGGTRGTQADIQSALAVFPPEQRRLDLLVISHIDRDHLEGILNLLEKDELGFQVDDVWFNGLQHLPDPDEHFGVLQGGRLTDRILKLNLPWNKAFDAKAVVVSKDDQLLPVHTLAGGMKITLLSPTRKALADLRRVWDKEIAKANLDPRAPQPAEVVTDTEEEEFGGGNLPDVKTLSEAAFKRDQSEANASSIAFLAEFEGKRVLFGADAHADVVLESLNRLSPDERVGLNLFKISHHGSQGTTNIDLLKKVDCSTYLISTNGSIFHHPDQQTIARVLTNGGNNLTFIFNYRSETNKIWDEDLLKTKYGYRALYPGDGKDGIDIEL